MLNEYLLNTCLCFHLGPCPSRPHKIGTWRAHFDGADRDRSGSLSRPEVGEALRRFGFSLPDHVFVAIMAAFDEDKRASPRMRHVGST